MDHFEKMAAAEYLEGRLREEEHQHFEIATGDAEATSMRARRNKEGVKLSPTPEAQRGVDQEWTKEEKRRWEESRNEAKEKESEAEDKGEKRRKRSKEEERKLEEKRAQKRWRSTSRRSRSRGKARKEDEKEKKKADLRWRPGEGKYGMLKEEKQKEKRLDQQGFVGGMKNPMEVVEGLPTLQNLGRRIWGAWERHCMNNPKVLKVGEQYGSEDCKLEGHLVERWKEVEAWCRRGGDPETEVHWWIKEGVPLGVNVPIKTCNVFPPALKEEAQRPEDWRAAQGLREDIGNYVSVREQEEDAKIEIDRLIDRGYAVKARKGEVERAGFKGTTISKLGLIVKTKEGGAKKRRIIIDLRRSGGNRKAVLPERLILPRPMDAIAMVRRMHASKAELEKPQDKTLELVMIDVSDAYMHLAVAEEEKGHCLAPALDDEHWLLFIASSSASRLHH